MEQALLAKDMAESCTINVSDLKELSNDQRQMLGVSDNICLYRLPGQNFCVPSFDDSEVPFVHIMNKKV